MTAPANKRRSIKVGDKRLDYSLQRTQRRKTVAIFVEPDGTVSVLAPKAADDIRVEQIVRQRATWIRKQQRTVEALPPPPQPRQWVNGETHRYLGRQYRLKIVKSAEPSVKLAGAFFVVTVPNPRDRESIKNIMGDWYHSRAHVLLRGRIESVIRSSTWLDLSPPPFSIRPMKARWGSTSQLGRITFNCDLIKLPRSCIDYVVAHELVHLKIPNHSPAYWRMLTRVMPDWKRWRDKLWTTEM